ncbi:MAG TPA: DUF1648 domain-containing protein [Candidatus Dojkabacteria bacterium]|nr:DUF1648 domain-containing protein [Candidatus Dojkabacteria bacterium]
MKIRKNDLYLLLIPFISFVVGILFYPFLPDTISSHWNINGEVDGTMGKFWGVFLLPIISVVLSAIFIIAPKVDPNKESFEEYRNSYEKLVLYISVFFLGLYLLMLLWNIDIKIPVNIYFSLGLSGLLYNIALAMENVKMNWFMGIRTPWTLSSDRVWNSTHKLAAKLFKFSAIFVLVGLLSSPLMLVGLAPFVLSALYLVIFSYIEYRKEK